MLSADEKQVSYKPWVPSAATGEAPPVHIGERVARELGVRVREAAHSLPRRGLEVGGLLLGSAGTDGVYVEWFAPIESEYPEGPCFRVPESNLLAAIERAEQHAGVVGIYRSRTDYDLELDSQDHWLLEKLSATTTPLAIFMFLATATAPPAGRVGLWENSRERWLGPAQPWQVWLTGDDSVSPQGASAVAVSRDAAPALASELEEEETGLIAAPFGPDEPAKRSGHKLAAVVSAAALASFAWILLRDPSPQSLPDVADPAFSAGRSRTPDPLPSQAPSAPGSPSAALRPPESSDPRPSPFGQPPAPESPVMKARVVEPPKPAFQVPPQRTSTDMQEESLNPGPAPSISARIDDSAPKQTSPPIDIPGEVPAREHAIEFTPPVLARQSGSVVVPPDVRRLIQHEVLLELKVNVNEGGNVTSVAPVRALDRTEQALLRTYSSAISTWVFEPGRRNGQAVPAEVILRFRVQPPN